MSRPKGPDSMNLVSEKVLRQVVKLLREAGAKGCTKDQLREAINVKSLRTVDRSIDLLEEQGAKLSRSWITVDSGDGNRRAMTISLLRGPIWDETLSASARLALGVLLEGLRTGVAAAWTDQLEKVASLVDSRLTNRDRNVFEVLRTKVVASRSSTPATTPPESVLKALIDALGSSNPRRVTLRYDTAYRKQEHSYEVAPWCLVHDVFSGGAYLIAWDLGAGQPKSFRLDRIREAALGGASALLPEERAQLDRAATYQIGGWIGQGEPIEISVRITGNNWVRSLLDQAPALPAATVKKETGGSVLVTFKAMEWHGPARWVLQMGPNAQVLGPAEFREHVGKMAKAILKNYFT